MIRLPVPGRVLVALGACLALASCGSFETRRAKLAERGFTVSGDARVRDQSDVQLDDAPNRRIDLVRLRVAAKEETAHFVAEARVGVGDLDEPDSPDASAGNLFERGRASIDTASVTVRQAKGSGFWLSGGKFFVPAKTNPVYGELVLDGSVEMAGLAAGWSRKGGGTLKSVGLMAAEQKLIPEKALMTSVQAATSLALSHHVTAGLILGYYAFSRLDISSTTATLDDEGGNATVDVDGDGEPDRFASDFRIVDPIVWTKVEAGSVPIVVAAELIKNTAAGIPEDHGWALGVRVGETEKRGDWGAAYQYQVVEQDAVFTAASQDDFLMSSNHRSHLLAAKYQILDHLGARLSFLGSRRDKTFDDPALDSTKLQWRIWFDVDARF